VAQAPGLPRRDLSRRLPSNWCHSTNRHRDESRRGRPGACATSAAKRCP